MWKNIYSTAGQAARDNIIRRMRFVCWITKATGTHSEYVMLIACALQRWLRQATSMLYARTLPVFSQCTSTVNGSYVSRLRPLLDENTANT